MQRFLLACTQLEGHRLRRASGLILTLVLLACAMRLLAQPTGPDPNLVTGIRCVEEGDFEAALSSLGRAVRTLSNDARRSQELAQAHLYLGIAYVYLDQEKAGRASFREALKLQKDLRLSPDAHARKVLRVFEAALGDARADEPNGKLEILPTPGKGEPSSTPPVAAEEVVQTRPDPLPETYETSCTKGDMAACTTLGALYENGQGVRQDRDRAKALYGQACEGGEKWACYYLANLLGTADAVSPKGDSARALAAYVRDLYKKACERGVHDACRRLGRH